MEMVDEDKIFYISIRIAGIMMNSCYFCIFNRRSGAMLTISGLVGPKPGLGGPYAGGARPAPTGMAAEASPTNRFLRSGRKAGMLRLLLSLQ